MDIPFASHKNTFNADQAAKSSVQFNAAKKRIRLRRKLILINRCFHWLTVI